LLTEKDYLANVRGGQMTKDRVDF